MQTLPSTAGILRTFTSKLCRSAWTPALALGAVLASGLTASAGTMPVRIAVARPVIRIAAVQPILLGATTQPSSNANHANEIQTLTQAYNTLATADHDYKGHRVHAMKAIENAAKIMGASLSGDDKDKETQSLSDGQLAQVKANLEGVLATAEANHQRKVVYHLKIAIKHLTIALKIK